MKQEEASDFASSWRRAEEIANLFIYQRAESRLEAKVERELRESVSKSISLAFGSNQQKQLLEVDIFGFLDMIVQTEKMENGTCSEILPKVMEWAQMIVSNTPSGDLDALAKQPSFGIFFRAMAKHLAHEEIADYWANLCKSIALRLTPTSEFELYEFLFETVVRMGERNSLLETARRATFLSILKLQGERAEIFRSKMPFLFIFFEIPRKLLALARVIDAQTFEAKTGPLQNSILDFQETLLYSEELISSAQTIELRSLAINVFVSGFYVPLLLPPLRSDMESLRPMLGINAAMFLLNQVFDHGKKFILRNLLNNFLCSTQEPIGPLNSYFSEEILNDSIETVSSKPELFAHLHKEVKIVSAIGSDYGSKAISTLVVFLKSKDDNMVLNASALLLNILSSRPIVLVLEERNKLIEQVVHLITADGHLKRVTKEVLILLALKVAGEEVSELMEVSQKLVEKEIQFLTIISTELEGRNRHVWLEQLVLSATRTQSEVFQDLEKFSSLMLINYQFIEGSETSSQFSNLPLNFKYLLTPEEAIKEICWAVQAFGQLLVQFVPTAQLQFQQFKSALLTLSSSETKRLRNNIGKVILLKPKVDLNLNRLIILPSINDLYGKARAIVGVGRELGVLEETNTPSMYKVLSGDLASKFKIVCQPYYRNEMIVGEGASKLRIPYTGPRELSTAEAQFVKIKEEIEKAEILSVYEPLKAFMGVCAEFRFKVKRRLSF